MLFHVWVTQELLPITPDKAAIVDGQRRISKRQDTFHAIETAEFSLEYLPPYSLQLDPIEKLWTQAKAIRRRTQCSVETLFCRFRHYHLI